MTQINIHINPMTTRHVLQYLGLAIDEIKLVSSIESYTEQLKRNTTSDLELGRRHYIVSQMRFLKKRLRSIRKTAKTCEIN